ncbi:hypothetical protein OF364_01030 [Mycoplasma enhydrae]|uniref:OppA family ABC transporter substrate-binding lipoprotein n=1 Tax=Mycoplasma enhydrae TaxID=2499220 RepID=UPI0021E70974|nr:hypothetical protein [Mycoplasma enhydrae]MCV3753399.1 hypothetical protein [Mycoplasma enhydrae]
MRKNLLLWMPTTLLPLCSISCIKNNFNNNKFVYIEKNNFANDYGDFAYLNHNFTSDNIRAINLATSAKLFRLKSEQQPLIDFRDNIVLVPSSISYNFELANKIVVNSKTKNYEFSNDSIDKIDFNPKDDVEIPGVFKPKRDKGNGFNSPFLNIPSSNTNSINHKVFKTSLSEAKSIEIYVQDLKNIWVDYNGNLVNNLPLNISSFRLGLLAHLLKNPAFRNEHIKKNNLKTTKVDNPVFKGFDLYSFLINNKINVNKLLDFSSNKLTLETIDGSFVNFETLFNNLFIIQNYFDALPYEYIIKKYGNPLKSIKWFFEYGKTFKDRLFSSFYYISTSNSNQITLNINKYYKKVNKSALRQIKIEYNPLKNSQKTHSSQSINAFKQNIISKINYEELSIDDKKYILKNNRRFNISYEKNFNRFRLANNIVINHKPNMNSPYMNKYFLELYYGLNNQKYELKTINMAFQSLFNNIINQYALVQDNKDIWLSQAPQNLYLKAKNKALNYEELKDAFVPISVPIIFKKNLDKIKDTFQFKNKQKISDPEIIDINKKMQSFQYKTIKEELSKIIDEFYQNKADKKSIYLNLPIVVENENQFVNDRIAVLKNNLNSIHKKLRVDITIVDNFEKYNEYLKSNKSIYKHDEFRLFQGDSVEYIFSVLKNENNGIVDIAKTLKKHEAEFLKNHTYENLINLQTFLDNNSISLLNINDVKVIKEYLNNLNMEQQISLINELNNLLSYTLNFNNQINIDSFYKVVYQRHIIKPLSPNNLNYFQDIRIRGK